MELEWGKIKTINTDIVDKNGDNATCIVIPNKAQDTETLPLYIPCELRKRFKNVQEGEEVLYAVKGNGYGMIIALLPDYMNDKVDDWDMIVRNDNVPIQFTKDVFIQGTATVTGDVMTDGNLLVEGDTDVVGNLNADGDVCINKTIEAKGGKLNIDGTQIKINGTTATGAKPFNGFPSGSDTFTGAPVSQDTVMGTGSIAGGNAKNNEGNYTKAEENEEREVS